jgi:hypothetical protein
MKKRPTLLEAGWIAGLARLAVAGLLAGCKSSAPPTAKSQATATQEVSPLAANTAPARLRNGAKILTAAIAYPKTPFHYSYKGQQNVTANYNFDKTAKPQVGAVSNVFYDRSSRDCCANATNSALGPDGAATSRRSQAWRIASWAHPAAACAPCPGASLHSVFSETRALLPQWACEFSFSSRPRGVHVYPLTKTSTILSVEAANQRLSEIGSG